MSLQPQKRMNAMPVTRSLEVIPVLRSLEFMSGSLSQEIIPITQSSRLEPVSQGSEVIMETRGSEFISASRGPEFIPTSRAVEVIPVSRVLELLHDETNDEDAATTEMRDRSTISDAISSAQNNFSVHNLLSRLNDFKTNQFNPLQNESVNSYGQALVNNPPNLVNTDSYTNSLSWKNTQPVKKPEDFASIASSTKSVNFDAVFQMHYQNGTSYQSGSIEGDVRSFQNGSEINSNLTLSANSSTNTNVNEEVHNAWMSSNKLTQESRNEKNSSNHHVTFQRPVGSPQSVNIKFPLFTQAQSMPDILRNNEVAQPREPDHQLATRSREHGNNNNNNNNSANTDETSKKKSRQKRRRILFSRSQVTRLQERFGQQCYLSTVEREQLASALGLSAGQIKIWFQNHRYKLKKLAMDDSIEQIPDSPDKLTHSITASGLRSDVWNGPPNPTAVAYTTTNGIANVINNLGAQSFTIPSGIQVPVSVSNFVKYDTTLSECNNNINTSSTSYLPNTFLMHSNEVLKQRYVEDKNVRDDMKNCPEETFIHADARFRQWTDIDRSRELPPQNNWSINASQNTQFDLNSSLTSQNTSTDVGASERILFSMDTGQATESVDDKNRKLCLPPFHAGFDGLRRPAETGSLYSNVSESSYGDFTSEMSKCASRQITTVGTLESAAAYKSSWW